MDKLTPGMLVAMLTNEGRYDIWTWYPEHGWVLVETVDSADEFFGTR